MLIINIWNTHPYLYIKYADNERVFALKINHFKATYELIAQSYQL